VALVMGFFVPHAHAATILPPPETCFQATTATSGGPGTTGTGFIGLLGAITPGSGGTTGTYFTALTGGSGINASANITVSGGIVTAVNIYNPGTGYVIGDVLSAASGNIGNVGGFSVPVASVSINSALAGGQVYTYIANTTTPKSTWFNADQSSNHQNTNPVKLDANGCAIIYGIGSYQFVVQDSLGNTIYSQVITDTSASNSVFWAGLDGGTPNNITLNDPGFNATAGSVINFKAIANSTGPVTFNPSGYGAIPAVVNSAVGPIPLTGGEITQNGVFSIIYDSIASDFLLVNPANSSGGGGGGGGNVPVSGEIACTGFAAPANYMFEFGQALSRSTYASLFAQLTISQTGSLVATTPTITGLTDTQQFDAGDFVEGSGIPAATTILSVDSSSQVTLSANATTSGTSVIRFFAYPNGDGATTFNIPDKRGRTNVGRDNMGGTAAGTLLSTYTTNSPDALGSLLSAASGTAGGGFAIKQTNLPNLSFAVNIAGGQGSHLHTVPWFNNVTGFGSGGSAGAEAGSSTNTTTSTLPAMSGTAASGGSNRPMSIINPGITTNLCLRVQ